MSTSPRPPDRDSYSTMRNLKWSSTEKAIARKAFERALQQELDAAIQSTKQMAAGLRVRKEALPLKWSDVDLESEPGCISVRDSKTAAGVRPVWLTKHCRNTLIQWREFLGPGFSQYVFPSPRIPSTHVCDYKKGWQKAAREAGITDRRIYDLRASFASRANACRASGLTIAQLLGHANNTQILPTYVKPLDENTKAVIDALDAARTSRSTKLPSVQ